MQYINEVLAAILGMALGATVGVITTTTKFDKDRLQVLQKVFTYCCWILFGLGICYVLYWNIGTLSRLASGDNQVSNFNSFLAIFLKIKANLQFISVAVFAGLVGLVSIVIRIPFTRWESIKFFGFEAKRVLEDAKKVVSKELSIERKIDEARSDLVATFTSETVIQHMLNLLVQDQSIERVIQYMLSAYSDYFKEALDVNIQAGIIPVTQEYLPRHYLNPLEKIIQQCINHTMNTGIEDPWNEPGKSVLITKLHVSEFDDSYFLVHMYSKDYKFTESDANLVEAIGNIIDLLMFMLKNGVIISGQADDTEPTGTGL